jgi:prophage antirepressor-like protein
VSIELSLCIPSAVIAAAPRIRVAGTKECPLFCLADLCAVLGIGNPAHAATRLDDDEKGIVFGDTPGGPQQMLFVTESGLYTTVVRSNRPASKPFRKWTPTGSREGRPHRGHP